MMPESQSNHDMELMTAALAEARAALDVGEFPVGCVVALDDRILARGRRRNSRGEAANELDHAEVMAVRTLLAEYPEINPGEVSVYATMEPCLMCYATLILNGIRRIVFAYEDAMGGGTSLDLSNLAPLYREMRVEITPHVLRDESLALFRDFFNNPDNLYWRDSPLAEYTLRES